jgi:two-component system LytT family response regulator
VRAFLIDDEPLALKRLERMLLEAGRVTVAGSAIDPEDALVRLRVAPVDVLFLDIEMPGMDGFSLLSQLHPQPFVIFTTAYNQYALKAFEVHSVDYLLKPIEPEQLDRALRKLDRMAASPKPDLTRLLADLMEMRRPASLERVASRVGDRVEFVDLSRVTHFYAEDKLTYAATDAKNYIVDQTIAELETRLDPARFVRIHRSTIVRIDAVHEMYSYFGGKMLLRLKDAKRTELTVARDRVKELKEKLGL